MLTRLADGLGLKVVLFQKVTLKIRPDVLAALRFKNLVPPLFTGSNGRKYPVIRKIKLIDSDTLEFNTVA